MLGVRARNIRFDEVRDGSWAREEMVREEKGKNGLEKKVWQVWRGSVEAK